MERHTTANTAGNTLTLQAGGATAGATDKESGMLVLAPGTSTGIGFSSIKLQGLSRATSTGTSDNVLSDRIIIPSEFNLTNSSANSLFEVELSTLGGIGGSIEYSIYASNGTDIQQYTGNIKYTAVNKGGVYTTSIVDTGSTFSCSAGTLTTAWTITPGTNKVTIAVTPTSSLTNTTYKIRYTITNLSNTLITQL
jgi:hypothetical protein